MSKRIKLSNIVQIKSENEIEGNFTSIRGEYIIPFLNQKGFLKENGCMDGAMNDEDLREYFSARVLDQIEVPHADIFLIENDIDAVDVFNRPLDKHGCISISVLEDNESFIKLKHENLENKPRTSIQNYIKQSIDEVSNLPNITKSDLEERKKFLVQYLFASAMIGNTDVKSDNCQVIYNRKTNRYRNPKVYDMGLAFVKGRNYFLKEINANEIIKTLYSEYYEYISNNVLASIKNLTPEFLKNNIPDEFDKKVRKQIKADILERISLLKQLEKESSQNSSLKKYHKNSWIEKIKEFFNTKLMEKRKLLTSERKFSKTDKEITNDFNKKIKFHIQGNIVQLREQNELKDEKSNEFKEKER